MGTQKKYVGLGSLNFRGSDSHYFTLVLFKIRALSFFFFFYVIVLIKRWEAPKKTWLAGLRKPHPIPHGACSVGVGVLVVVARAVLCCAVWGWQELQGRDGPAVRATWDRVVEKELIGLVLHVDLMAILLFYSMNKTSRVLLWGNQPCSPLNGVSITSFWWLIIDLFTFEVLQYTYQRNKESF